MPKNKFEADLEALKKNYRTDPNGFEAAYAFLALYEKQARAVRASDPAEAVRLLKLAEDCQATIGTYATGSGEGLESMANLYALMGERAQILEVQASQTGKLTERVVFLNEALALWQKINADPNGQGRDTPAKQKIGEIQKKLKP